MNPEKVAAVESRRISQHERIKGKLEAEVHARIEREAAQPAPADQAQVEAVASRLKHKATSEVAETEEELERARHTLRVSQFVDYAFYLVYGLVGLEIALELLGARQGNAFKRFLDVVTWPLLAPFRGLMPDPAVGSFQLMLSYVVALIVYFLLHRSLLGLMRIFAERKATL